MGRFRNITGKGISVLILALSVKMALLACVPASQQTTVEPETPPAAVHDPSQKVRLSNAINHKVTASAASRSITAGGRNMRLSPALPGFYQKRAYEAVWIDDNGNPRQADQLVEAVKASYYEGLSQEQTGLPRKIR